MLGKSSVLTWHQESMWICIQCKKIIKGGAAPLQRPGLEGSWSDTIWWLGLKGWHIVLPNEPTICKAKHNDFKTLLGLLDLTDTPFLEEIVSSLLIYILHQHCTITDPQVPIQRTLKAWLRYLDAYKVTITTGIQGNDVKLPPKQKLNKWCLAALGRYKRRLQAWETAFTNSLERYLKENLIQLLLTPRHQFKQTRTQ